MGCDIHCYAERKTKDGWEDIPGIEPFDWRSYSLYGFLAGVRNYSGIPPISNPRGLPADSSETVKRERDDWDFDGHSTSYLTVEELLEFDYDRLTEDRRVTRLMPGGYMSGGQTCEPGEGKHLTFREFLGEGYFEELNRLKTCGVDRIVFWFDN